MNKSHSPFAMTLLAAALSMGLVACGSKDEKKTASQLAAKVGSAEISVHQINQVLSRTNASATSPEAAKAMSREVLEKLIDQQLAIEQATENKLDRTPDVLSQIEASRREIIARAYLQKIAAAQPKPSVEEVKKYFADYPQLFSERRIYNLQEVVVPAAAGVSDQFRSFVTSGKSIEDAVSWLKNKDVKFRSRAIKMEAEQIPMEALARLHKLKDGQSLLVEAPQGITMLRIAASQSAPVTEAVALPRIEQYLTNQRATEALTAKFKELRAASKIAYVGEFAKTDDAAPPAPAPQANAAPAPTEEEKAKAILDKGIAGMK
jgi:EpsD family peptidyl-prolyl cis-trans isomerase